MINSQRLIGVVCWLVLLSGASDPLKAREVIHVGGYLFPPYVEQTEDREAIQGLTPALLQALNQVQTQYDFRFFLTSPNRRYQDFQEYRYSLIFFESIHWGWQDFPVEASPVLIRDGEVYIALAVPGRDQSWFNHFAEKTLVGIVGYHYGFAGFNRDPDYLARQHQMILTQSHAGSIQMVLQQRGDIAVVTRSYLRRYLRQHPAEASQILISKRLDQEYLHTILARRGSQPSLMQINQWLEALEHTGKLATLWQEYGLE